MCTLDFLQTIFHKAWITNMFGYFHFIYLFNVEHCQDNFNYLPPLVSNSVITYCIYRYFHQDRNQVDIYTGSQCTDWCCWSPEYIAHHNCIYLQVFLYLLCIHSHCCLAVGQNWGLHHMCKHHFGTFQQV